MPPAAYPLIQIEEQEYHDDFQNKDQSEIIMIQNDAQNEGGGGDAGAPVAKKPKRKSQRQLADEKSFRTALNRLRLPDNGQIKRPVRTTRNRLP